MTPSKHLQIESNSVEQTLALGESFAKNLPNGTVVTLHGTLGAGKTVLARAIARGLGIREPVTSPTFALVMEYPRPTGDFLFHLDMYRIDNEMDAIAFGVEDYLFQDTAVTLVEWPERLSGLLTPTPGVPRSLAAITITHDGEDTRMIELPDWLTM